jgi:hypothetical protein
MGSYPLNFPVNAGNPGPLRDIASAAAAIAKETGASAGDVRFLQIGLDGLTKSGLSTKQALSELAKANGTVTPGVNRLATELLGADAAFTAVTAGSQRFGNSIRSNVVAPVTAASGAIRVLEGNQSIRVIENLLAKTLGLGPAFQAAFPIFGAIAMTEMLGQMVEKVGKLYNQWDPVVRAQERALSSMKELNAEYNKLSGDSLKRIYDDIENRPGPTGGRANRLRAEARDIAKDAAYQDASRIKTIEAQIEATQRRLEAGKVAAVPPSIRIGRGGAEFGVPGTPAGLTRDAQAARDDLQRLDAELENARLKQKDDQLRAKDLRGEAAKVDRTKAEEAARKAAAIDNEIRSKYLTRDRTVEVPRLGPSGAPFIDPKTGNPLTITVPSPVLNIYAERDEMLRRLKLAPHSEQASEVRGGANIKAAQEVTKEQDEATKMRMERELFTRQKFERESPDNAIRATGIVAGMPEESALKLTGKDIEEGLKRNAESLLRNAKDANSMQAAVRSIEQESAKHQAETQTRLQASLATSGMTGVRKITTEGALDIQGAARSRDEQIAALGPAVDKLKPLMEYTADEFKRMEASAKIVSEYKEKEGQIAARTLIQLDQERQRSAEQHASTFAAGIMAAATHSGEQFGRGLGRSIGEKMLENFGKNFIFQKGGPFEKLQGTIDPASFLGKITHETGLFREESPLNAPALKFDFATERFSDAVDRYSGAKSSPTSTTGQFGAGVPGYSNFGSGTNAKYGPLSGAVSISKSIEGFFHRKPMPPSAQGQVALSGTASLTRPLSEHITTLLGGSDGEGLSGRGGFEGIAGGSANNASKIEAEAQLIQSQQALAATNADQTAATKDLTKTFEYVATGGAAGQMPEGATPPVVTGGAAGVASVPGLNTLSSDIFGIKGGASDGLGAIGAAIPALGAFAMGVTAFSKLTGIGQQGHGEHAGVAGGGGGSIGDGAMVTYAPGGLANSPALHGANGYGEDPLTGDTIVNPRATSKIASSISTIQKGIGKFAGAMANPFGGAFAPDPSRMSEDVAYGPGQAGGSVPTKGLSGVGALGFAAAGADVALGAITAVSQFKKGGARGALGGTSAILGTAAALTAGVPILGEALGIAALGTSLVKSMLGDPKVERQKQISKNLFLDQYQAPQAQNITSSTMGTFADIGRSGDIRTSSLSPYARTTSAYLDLPYRFNVPGTQTSQFGGGGPITINNNVTNHVAAMDAGSFETFLKKNPTAVAEGVAHGLSFGASRATGVIKGLIGQG